MRNYICTLNEAVERKHVRYNNRYGFALAGDLYTAKDMDKNSKYPAVVVGAPYGGVKEQGPSVYANELAKRGFVVLTFDPCYMGESAGEPRHVSSPDMFSENISAGVDCLGLLSYVDRDRIGAVGICGSGGFSLSAAAMDMRIKAGVTASMYDMSYAARAGQTPEQITENKKRLSLQRWIDVENGYPEYIPSFPEDAVTEIPAEMQGIWREFFEFYATKRGHHPNARGGFTTTSDLSFINYPLLAHIDEISPRPILFIVGEQAESRFFSDAAFENAQEPKEMMVIPNCNHVDLYDDVTKIPFDKYYAQSLAAVLLYLHRFDPPYIYRDMKPMNVLVTNSRAVKLIDFGIAMEYKPGAQNDIDYLGTRGYAAPEQYGGKGAIDQRSDIYGLGITMHQLLTGIAPNEPPYEMPPVRRVKPKFRKAWNTSSKSVLPPILMNAIITVRSFCLI